MVTDIIRIDTLHYADKAKTEAYIMELMLWLNHLINQTKAAAESGGEPVKSPIDSAANQTKEHQQPKLESAAASKSPFGLEPVEQRLINGDEDRLSRSRGQ